MTIEKIALAQTWEFAVAKKTSVNKQEQVGRKKDLEASKY